MITIIAHPVACLPTQGSQRKSARPVAGGSSLKVTDRAGSGSLALALAPALALTLAGLGSGYLGPKWVCREYGVDSLPPKASNLEAFNHDHWDCKG